MNTLDIWGRVLQALSKRCFDDHQYQRKFEETVHLSQNVNFGTKIYGFVLYVQHVLTYMRELIRMKIKK